MAAVAATVALPLVLGLYYILVAAAVYRLLGRFSSPNPAVRDVKLLQPASGLSGLSAPTEEAKAAAEEEDDGDGDGGDIEAPPAGRPAGLSAARRKMSFLETAAKESAERANPFMNLTWAMPPGERTKMALLAPLLLPIRTVLLFGSLLGGVVFSSLATWGADLNEPLAGWRHALQRPVALFARGVLFALGYHWIKVEGTLADSGEAPVLVSNHMSFVDPIYLAGCCLSMGISLEENARIPIFGGLIRQLQCVFVSRGDKDSRAKVASEIQRRVEAQRGQWRRRLLVFPEGTTTNGSAVISFKPGAFAPGVSVQPVAVRYTGSNATADPSWVSGGPHPGELMFKLMCQPHNAMTVRFLPVHHPTPTEAADPLLFADAVRREIAGALGVPATVHTLNDVLLLVEARKLGYRGSLEGCVTALAPLQRLVGVDLPRAKELLREFAAGDGARKGGLTFPEFGAALGVPEAERDAPALRGLFDVLDAGDKGVLNLQAYVAGAALLNATEAGAFDEAMKLLFKTVGTGAGRLSKAEAGPVLRRLWPGLAPAFLDETFEAADADGDGRLDAAEFLAVARAHQAQCLPGPFRDALLLPQEGPGQAD